MNKQTQTTLLSSTVTLAAHARRGLMILIHHSVYKIVEIISVPSISLSPHSLPISIHAHTHTHPQAPSDHHNSLSGMWGRLSCYILVADWESALEELNSLRKHIDDSVSKSLDNHPPFWSIFVLCCSSLHLSFLNTLFFFDSYDIPCF